MACLLATACVWREGTCPRATSSRAEFCIFRSFIFFFISRVLVPINFSAPPLLLRACARARHRVVVTCPSAPVRACLPGSLSLRHTATHVMTLRLIGIFSLLFTFLLLLLFLPRGLVFSQPRPVFPSTRSLGPPSRGAEVNESPSPLPPKLTERGCVLVSNTRALTRTHSSLFFFIIIISSVLPSSKS